METEREPAILISFAEEDMSYVQELYTQLNQKFELYRWSDSIAAMTDMPVKAWFYPQQHANIEFEHRIKEQIDLAPAVIVVLSPQSGASHWVFKEVNWIYHDPKKRKPVIVIAIGEIPALRQTLVGQELAHIVWINLNKLANPQEAIEEVLRALRGQGIVERSYVGDVVRLGRRLTTRPYGGMYEGVLVNDQSRVVVKKVVSSDFAVLYELDQRIERRRNLVHSALPAIRAYQHQGNERYVVMQEVLGDSTMDILDKLKRPYRWEEIQAWAEQLLELLIHMHGQKVPHLAIKPHNLKPIHGVIKLLDVGLDQHPPNTNTESPDPYLSPEQWNNLPADERSDLYSLGATLFTLLTRDQQPYPNKQFTAEQRRDIPPYVVQAIYHAMQAEPSKRFQKASAMLSALTPPSQLRTITLEGEVKGTFQLDVYGTLLPQLRAILGAALQPGIQVQIGSTRRELGDNDSLETLGLQGSSSIALFQQRKRGIPAWQYAAIALISVVVLAAIFSSVNALFGNAGGATQVSSQTSVNSTPAATSGPPTTAPTDIPPTASGPTAPPTAAPTATTVPASPEPIAILPIESLPCENEQILEGDLVYTIAVNVPLTSGDSGDNAKAQAMINASCLAYEKMLNDPNALPMPKGIKLRLVVYDDGGDVKQAQPVANTVVTHVKDGGACVVGHRSSELTNRAITIYKNAQIPLFAPSNSGIDVSKNGGIRLAGSDDGQAAAIIEFIQNGGEITNTLRLQVVHDSLKDPLAHLVSKTASTKGMVVLPTLSFTTSDLNSIGQVQEDISKQADQFDVLFIAATKVDDAMALITGLREAGFRLPIIVNDAIDSPQLRTLVTEQPVYYATMSMLPGDMSTFGKNYLEKYGDSTVGYDKQLVNIPSYTAETYDATVMCITELLSANVQSGTPLQEQIWANLQNKIAAGKLSYGVSYKDFATVTGPYDYNNELNFKNGGTYYIGVAGDPSGAIKKYRCPERLPTGPSDSTCTVRN